MTLMSIVFCKYHKNFNLISNLHFGYFSFSKFLLGYNNTHRTYTLIKHRRICTHTHTHTHTHTNIQIKHTHMFIQIYKINPLHTHMCTNIYKAHVYTKIYIQKKCTFTQKMNTHIQNKHTHTHTEVYLCMCSHTHVNVSTYKQYF